MKRKRGKKNRKTDFYLIAPICVFANKQTGMENGKIGVKSVKSHTMKRRPLGYASVWWLLSLAFTNATACAQANAPAHRETHDCRNENKSGKFKRTTKTSKIVSKCQNETKANYVIADITLKFRMNSLHLFYN